MEEVSLLFVEWPFVVGTGAKVFELEIYVAVPEKSTMQPVDLAWSTLSVDSASSYASSLRMLVAIRSGRLGHHTWSRSQPQAVKQ